MRSKLMKPIAFFTSLVFIGLTGCELIATKEKTDREVSTAITKENAVAADTWSMDANSGVIQIDWLESFNDSVLIQLINEAQLNNRNLQAAAAKVERARALAIQAGASLAPNVNLASGASGSGTANGNSSGNLSLGLQVNWELDVWGRISAGKRAAVASAEAAEADFIYSQHSIAATTAKSYFAAIEVNEQIRIIESTLKALEEIHRLVTVKYANGVAGAQDLALATADLASARERLINIKGTQRDTTRALELLLGRYPNAELEVRDSLPTAPDLPPAGLPSELLERRPDIIAAERQVAAAFNSQAQAKSARLPAISLTGTVGGASNALNSLLNPANVAWQAGSSLLSPIFDGGTREAAVDVATADQKAALALYASAALNAFNEVERNLDQGSVLSAREAELSIVFAQATEAYRIGTVLYEEGASELLDALTFQQRAFTAESSLVSLHRLVLEQRVNLNLALGGEW